MALSAVTISGTTGYARRMQRVIGILVLVLVVFWIIDEPTGAAGTVNALLLNLREAGQSVVTFLQALV